MGIEDSKLKIRNNKLNITTDKVLACKDLDVLKDYQYKMSIHIAELTSKLDTANLKMAGGENISEEWVKRLKSYRSLQLCLERQINSRIKVLRRPVLQELGREKLIASFWKQKVSKISPGLVERLEIELEDLLESKGYE